MPDDRSSQRRVVLVTGGAGFIGSHVAEAAVEQGLDVAVVDDLSTGSAANVPREAELEVLDISDHEAFEQLSDRVRPSVILHLGAQSSVTSSVKDPRRDCVVNVQGTLNVLLAATRHRALVVFTSTGGALYGDQAPIPTPEDQPPAPISPYGASKWAGEAYVNTWRHATGLQHAVCRLGNVYGPRQSPHGEAGVVSLISYQLWRDQTPNLYGFGEATRDYVHVTDVARAVLAAVGKGDTFNISSGTETSVARLFELIQRAAGTSVTPTLAPLRPGELERSCIDPSRALRELGWRPQLDLEQGIQITHKALIEQFQAEAASAQAG